MLQLRNQTPFPASLTVLPDAAGTDTLVVALQGTFALVPRVAVGEEQRPFTARDEHWGEPATSSLRYASEIHPGKPGTDVVMVGEAFAPNGRPVPQLDVRLSVGPCTKVVRVFGDRTWKPGALPWSSAGPSAPETFVRMPLTYERAFGGVHETDDGSGEVLFEARNPVGRGFAGKRRGKELREVALPNLEDPAELLEKPADRPQPSGFGFVSPAWEPRRSYAGTYDDAWLSDRAPILPEDFDPRFFNAAHRDLVCDGHLRGDEPVEIDHACSRGPVRFRLPACEIAATVRLAGRTEKPSVRLETVLIEPEEGQLVLTWRATLPCDKQALRIEEVRLEVARMDLPGGSRR